MTDEELAKELGINRRTLTRWRGMSGFPKKETVAGIRKWRRMQKRRVVEPADKGEKAGAAAPAAVGAVSVARDDRERFEQALAAAYGGSLAWLDELVKKAGYRLGFIVSTTELVGLLGVSKTAVNNWVNSNGMPIEGRAPSGDTFDLARVLPWLIGYYKQRIERAREDKRESSEAVRKTRAEANLKELELAKRRGELVDVQDAVAKMAGVASNFTGAFRGVAADWSQAVEGKTPDAIARYLDAELTRIFGDLQNAALPENIPEAAAEHFRAGIAAVAAPLAEVEELKSQTVETQEGKGQ